MHLDSNMCKPQMFLTNLSCPSDEIEVGTGCNIGIKTQRAALKAVPSFATYFK